MPLFPVQQIASVIDVVLRHFVVADELLETQKSEAAGSDVKMRGEAKDDHEDREVNVEPVLDEGNDAEVAHDGRV